MNDLKRIILILFIGFGTLPSFGQDILIDGLMNSKWTSETKINDFNIGGLKEIRISKLKSAVDSIKSDLFILTFTDNEILIQRYKQGKGLDDTIVKCTYQYDSKKKEIKIFHWSQDSTFWEYSIVIVSTGSYVLMTRKKVK